MRILVIDDDPDMVTIISMLLTTNGHSPTGAYGGEEGLKIAREMLPDLILLDLMMPGIDGFEVLSDLRSYSSTENIPVVLVTAMCSAENEERARSMGAQAYITKPYRRDKFMETIRRASRSNVGQPFGSCPTLTANTFS
jgi:DNA-binding response OmpR family regulator